jgi:putative ABC transport system ATP-binding protein
MLIRLEGVTKSYATGAVEVRALCGVDLQIAAGELIAITGASGSGKSTVLNVLGTLDRPSAGRYLLDGQPVQARTDGELARIRNRKLGFVFQSFHLLARDTALQNVELPLIYAGLPPRERRARAADALERVGLSERMHHRPSQLSGGQQQRVSIARAIVNGPLVLLADEPTGALDSASTENVLALLLELNRQGMTIVVVTHDRAVAARTGRQVEFRDGRIVADRRAS